MPKRGEEWRLGDDRVEVGVREAKLALIRLKSQNHRVAYVMSEDCFSWEVSQPWGNCCCVVVVGRANDWTAQGPGVCFRAQGNCQIWNLTSSQPTAKWELQVYT